MIIRLVQKRPYFFWNGSYRNCSFQCKHEGPAFLVQLTKYIPVSWVLGNFACLVCTDVTLTTVHVYVHFFLQKKTTPLNWINVTAIWMKIRLNHNKKTFNSKQQECSSILVFGPSFTNVFFFLFKYTIIKNYQQIENTVWNLSRGVLSIFPHHYIQEDRKSVGPNTLTIVKILW